MLPKVIIICLILVHFACAEYPYCGFSQDLSIEFKLYIDTARHDMDLLKYLQLSTNNHLCFLDPKFDTMADFTGMAVRVTLKPPTNLQLIGKVKEVVPGQVLTLQDGKDCASCGR